MPTIVSQIQSVEHHLQHCQQRQSSLQHSLRHTHSHEERERLECEVREVGEEVKAAEQQLVSLRSENKRSMWVSVFIFALLAIFYYLFTMTHS